MIWFLERINQKVLPITFGERSRREHPSDFAKLVKGGVLKCVGNLSEIQCSRCQSEQLWQIREENGEVFYVCQNGCGKVALTDDEAVIFEYDNTAFLKLLANEFNIKTDAEFLDEAAYSNDSFYRIGMYEDKNIKANVYYLRTDDAYEPSSLFERLGNGMKVLITNSTKPVMASGKEGTRYCILVDTIAIPPSKHIFDAEKFKKCFEDIRRVRFDIKQGNLFLDEVLVYTAGLNSPEYYFLSCLWERWQEQVSHDEIHQYVRDAMGKGVADRAQVFCAKMKSSIKKEYVAIEKIITTQTIGHYSISDPRE